jgi:CHAD domain-containing protein
MEHSALSVALLRQRLVSLLKAMPAAQAGDETSVHQARVASRRLRQALPLLGVRADADALDRAGRRVRRITRALGPVRELDVTLLLLAELQRRRAAPLRAISRVRAAVTDERQQRRREMLAEIKPSRLNKLRKRLVQVAAPDSQKLGTRSALAEANRQAAERAAQLKSAIDRAGGIYLADRLHRVRVAAKKLRYALEIQRELTRSRSTAFLNRLKAQQDLLGRMHDFEILIDRTRGVQATLTPRDRRGMAELKKLIRVLEEECREGHATYMRSRPALIKMCDSIIAGGGSASTSSKASASAKAPDKSADKESSSSAA